MMAKVVADVEEFPEATSLDVIYEIGKGMIDHLMLTWLKRSSSLSYCPYVEVRILQSHEVVVKGYCAVGDIAPWEPHFHA
jgi:hypothetical protein